MFTTYTSLGKLASHTQAALRLKNTNFKYCFPYSRYDAEQLYWLSNGAQPAYPHKKIFFSHSGKDFKVGVHIEKGYGKDYSPKKNECLTNDWDWHTFVKSLKQGKLETLVDYLGEDQGYLHINIPPPDGSRGPSQDISFSLTPFTCSSTPPKSSLLRSFKNVTSGQELANALQQIPGHDFYWINVWLGISIEGKTSETNNQVSERVIDILQQMVQLF